MDARKLYLLQELLESSSSSDDEVLEAERLVKKPRIIHFISDVVAKYTDEEFKENFRVSRATAYQLISEFENSALYPSDSSRGGKKPISAQSHILSFLWYAGNKSSIRTISSRFGMGESTFHCIFNRVMEYLLSIAPKVIKFPESNEEKAKLANDFKQISGFPNVLGCIDGTYIPIRTPAHKIKSTYVNRHDMTSVTLQAICDNKRRFMDVFTGPPSKIHDARIFKLSFISEKLPMICTNRYHLLGDAAYSLREWLLTPFRDYGNLIALQKKFNYRLSATRVLIENSFGILKQRFRQLVRTDFKNVDTTTKCIISCCVLHNLCIDKADLLEEEDEEDEDDEGLDDCCTDDYQNTSDTFRRALGEAKRQMIAESLN